MSDDAPVEEPIDVPIDVPVGEPIDVSVEEPIHEAEGPEPTRWELPDPTGVPAVDDALRPLLELDELPTGEHVAHYEAVHRRLQDALADLDSA